MARARERHLGHLAVDALSLALSLALGGAILLLAFGTEILDWYWPAALGAIGLGTTFFRLSRRVPSAYVLAQRIDRRLDFHDTLSTALHFRNADGTSHPEIRAEQARQAENLARTADLKRALPFAAPRSLYVSAALAVAALTLFALRYGVLHTLDLRPSLAAAAFDSMFEQRQQFARQNEAARRQDEARIPGEQEQAADAQAGTQDASQAGTPDPGSSQDASRADSESKKEASNAGLSQKSGLGPQEGPDSNDTSLMDKMRDAVANLFDKLKPQSKDADQQQMAANKSGGQPGKEGPQSQQKGAPSAKPEDKSNTQSQPGQPQANNARNAQSHMQSADSIDPTTAQKGKSGIGSEDGDKALREAQQLQAMGKISELLGKRSANVQGQVMVEVASGNQQLRTPYSNQKGSHAEASGEIDRDEIPLMYQQFMQQYFHQVRKK